MARTKNTDEAVVETVVEAVETVEAEATPEAPIDLTGFQAVVTEAVTESDEATGTVPDALVAKVREVYQGLDGIKAKNAAKNYLAEQLKGYLTELNGPAAKAIMQLTEQAAVAGKSGGSTPKPPADPSEAFITHVAALTLALYLAQRQVPEGVDGEAAVASATEQANGAFEEALTVLASEDQATENALVRNAIRLASTKVRKSSGPRVATGDRRDLGAHIEEAIAAANEGDFLLVSDLRKFESTVYGKEHPSAGAITNRLEPKSGKPTTIPGIRVERRDNKLGAVVLPRG